MCKARVILAWHMGLHLGKLEENDDSAREPVEGG